LEYALTWYGLAVTLVGVYVAFVITRLRVRRGGGGDEAA
jgi:surfeit locus 1 family protein